VIDSDGHAVEFQPALQDYVRKVAGADSRIAIASTALDGIG
jgi:hypothetical protein